jgi:uncharacterized protein YbjQ (UPF0145 family)
MKKILLALIKFFRLVGSLGFVIGLFVSIFAGMPWYLYHEPILPLWLKISVFSFLGGLLLVLITVAAEQASAKPQRKRQPKTEPVEKILVQNAEEIPGRIIETNLGLVQGHTIYAIWIGKDLSSIIRLILGGELLEYTEMMGKARQIATQRMLDQAKELDADAVINVRFMTTSVIGSAAELLAYGTAVKLRESSTP